MESTTKSFVRGTVLLAFVLGLPAIAFFGVPDEVRVLLEADFLPWKSAAPATHGEQDLATADQPGTTGSHESHAHQRSPQPPSFFARTDSIHADYESATSDNANHRIALASAEARVLRQPVYRPLGSVEKSEVVRHLPSADGVGQGARSSTSDASAVAAIEARLRELGAVNYQLQQRTGQGRYRFVCVCANERGEQRTFESQGEDRLQAMQTVLDQVTAWRAGSVSSLLPLNMPRLPTEERQY